MSIGELAEFTRISKYAQAKNGRMETYRGSVHRVTGMHREFFADKIREFPKLGEMLDQAEQDLLDKKVLGSQRMLQFGGPGVLSKHARGYNCTFSHCSRPRFFQELFWLLLCGCGTGFSVQWRHVNMLPAVQAPTGPERVYVVPDTIEGWADAKAVLLSTYFVDDQPFPEWHGARVVFDFSQVRRKGALLSSGAKAPGPEPLQAALEAIRRLLDEVTAGGQAKLRPIHCYDICMFASSAVRSGGVRRSASICLFSIDDEEMAKAKTGDWYDTNRQRELSNNSAVLIRGQTSWEEYYRLFQWTRQYGEPGIAWFDHPDQGCNPCFEAVFWALFEVAIDDPLIAQLPAGTKSGIIYEGDTANLPGWQFCNLSTMNMSMVRTLEDFLRACRSAAFLGTLQACYTKFGYLGRVSELITEKEALLGVSMTGMCDSPEIAFDPVALEAGAQVVLDTNAEFAPILGINLSARSTLLKPEGTGSLVLGTFAAGIGRWKHRKGIRYATAADGELAVEWLKAFNPHVFAMRGETQVAAFPYRAPDGALIQGDTSALETLRQVRLVQKHWVEPGRRIERCTKPFLMHNVSNTIEVGPDEWEATAAYIFEHQNDFVGISMLRKGGDKAFSCAPYTEVKEEHDLIAKYGAVPVAVARVLAREAAAWSGGGPESWRMIDRAVAGRSTVYAGESFWRQVFEALAENVGGPEAAGDLVKDMELIERWQDLVERTVPVPWEDMPASDEDVDFQSEAACAGGGCLVDWDQLRAGAG